MDTRNLVQIADYINNSLVNGPGTRDVIFFSGCNHNCKGCHNEAAQDFNFGHTMSIDEIVEKVLKNKPMIDGVTISGGDPFFQYEGLFELCKKLKEHGLNIWVYTGHLYPEITEEYGLEIFKYIDVLVDGQFIEQLRDLDLKRKSSWLKYRGSSNQNFIYFSPTGQVIEVQREYKEMIKPVLYLSYPCSTFGNMERNIEYARDIQGILKKQGYSIINPLDIIPENMTWEAAMELSKKLYDGTEGIIIGSPLWFYSEGCTQEVIWAINDKKPIYIYGYGVNQRELKLVTENDMGALMDILDNRDKLIKGRKIK